MPYFAVITSKEEIGMILYGMFQGKSPINFKLLGHAMLKQVPGKPKNSSYSTMVFAGIKNKNRSNRLGCSKARRSQIFKTSRISFARTVVKRFFLLAAG